MRAYTHTHYAPRTTHRDDALSGLVHPKRDPLVNHNLVLLLSALYEGKQGFLPADYDTTAQPTALKKDQVSVVFLTLYCYARVSE
jgi:hypothetical protein